MGNLIMSEKERRFKALLEMVRLKKLKLGQVAEQTGYSYRQVKRRYKRYKAEGDAGLVHAARGRSSNNRNTHRALIIELYKQKYEGFGPVLASEKLFEDDGYNVNDETLRQWLLQEGLWCKVRKRSPYRKRRERKAQFGEL
jgi:transposase